LRLLVLVRHGAAAVVTGAVLPVVGRSVLHDDPLAQGLRVLQGVETAIVGVYEVSVSGCRLGRRGRQLTEDRPSTIHCGHRDQRGVLGGTSRLGCIPPVDPDEASWREPPRTRKGRALAQQDTCEVVDPAGRIDIPVTDGVAAGWHGIR
jgi:hypothetical protein